MKPSSQASGYSTPTSRQERRLWTAAALYVAAVYLSLAWARSIITPLRDAGHLRLTVGIALAGGAVAAAVWLARSRPTLRQWAGFGAVAAVFVPLLFWAETPEERLHLLQYGFLGGLLYRAFSLRGRRLRSIAPRPLSVRYPGGAATFWTAIAGWGDEGIQEILQSRVYDLRDVLVNFFAGALAVGALAAIERLKPKA